jgi:mercuric ion transport protein
MKQTVFFLILGLTLAACQGRSDQIAAENLESISFDVEGMTCTGCESSVAKSLENLEGVAQANASHERGKATVSFDKSMVTVREMEEAIESRGYRVKGNGPAE